jgi:hypothetical protein
MNEHGGEYCFTDAKISAACFLRSSLHLIRHVNTQPREEHAAFGRISAETGFIVATGQASASYDDRFIGIENSHAASPPFTF